MDKIIITSNDIFVKDGIQLSIQTNGIDLSEFIDNPIMLFNHEYDKPIGFHENIEVSETNIITTPNFDDDDFSQTIKNKFDRGSLKSASIGLVPIEGYIDENDVLIISKSILLEASIVAVPANPKAKKLNKSNIDMVTYAKNKEIIDMKKFKENIKLSATPTEEIISTEEIKSVEEVKSVEELKCDEDKIETAEMPVEDMPSEQPVEPSTPEEVAGDTIEMLNAVIEKLKSLLAEKESQIAEQSKEVESLKLSVETHIKEKKEALINDAIKLSKITPESFSTYIELSVEQLTNVFNSIQVKNISLSSELSKGLNKNTKSYDWYLKNDKEGLKKLSKENPSLYKQLEKEYTSK